MSTATAGASCQCKRKRSAYDAAFKSKVVNYAEANNNCAAAREFCVDEKQGKEWQKDRTTLEKIPQNKKSHPTSTWCASFPEL